MVIDFTIKMTCPCTDTVCLNVSIISANCDKCTSLVKSGAKFDPGWQTNTETQGFCHS